MLGATILTAIATLALAVFALITAVLAFMAWCKQSREVRDQVEMLKVQAERLAEDRKVNAEQIRVLGLARAVAGLRAGQQQQLQAAAAREAAARLAALREILPSADLTFPAQPCMSRPSGSARGPCCRPDPLAVPPCRSRSLTAARHCVMIPAESSHPLPPPSRKTTRRTLGSTQLMPPLLVSYRNGR